MKTRHPFTAKMNKNKMLTDKEFHRSNFKVSIRNMFYLNEHGLLNYHKFIHSAPLDRAFFMGMIYRKMPEHKNED